MKKQAITSYIPIYIPRRPKKKGAYMPTMIRIKGKPKNIAYKILGVPANIAYKPSKKEKEIKRRLLFEETSRVR